MLKRNEPAPQGNRPTPKTTTTAIDTSDSNRSRCHPVGVSGDLRPLTDEDLYAECGDDRPMTKAQARRVTEEMKLQVIGLWQLIKMAYVGRAWVVLGYESWDDYCAREFGTSRLRLPREERAEVIPALRDSGLSIRAIASAIGTGTRQVQEVLAERQVCSQTTPAPAAEDVLAEEAIISEPLGGLTEDSPGQTDRMNHALENARARTRLTPVLGIDGKKYRQKTPPTTEVEGERHRGVARSLTRHAESDWSRTGSLNAGRSYSMTTGLDATGKLWAVRSGPRSITV